MNLISPEARVEGKLAICLSLIAGYVDGYGLLVLGTYVSFMSGNTTFTGLNIGQGHFDAALPSAIAIASFVSGSFLGNLVTQSRLRHSHRIIFGLIAVILATIAGLDHRHDPWNAPSEIAMLRAAMGMLNPALSKIGAEAVSLTFVTGNLSRIGGHLASATGRKPLPDRQGPGDSHLSRARMDSCGRALIPRSLPFTRSKTVGMWYLSPRSDTRASWATLRLPSMCRS
jgi:uncharacterized membrane protein YoaK (UPF0700 family)